MSNIKIEITGLNDIIKKYPKAPVRIQESITSAFKKSLFQIQQEARKRTPVKTGHLRRSIGNPAFQGYRKIRAKIATMGTNVKYAFWVEVRHARHPVGDWKYMERGINASLGKIKIFFEREIAKAIKKLTIR